MSGCEALGELLEEVTRIRLLIELITRRALKEELNRHATTPERRKIWFLLDGSRSTTQIAEIVGLSQRAVQIFIRELQEADLVMKVGKGRYKRKIDYIPADWESDLEQIGGG